MKGKLIIFSAPSGAGKTSIVKHLLESRLPLEFSISACSRHPRDGEINGKDYFFLSVNEFQEKIRKNEFIEWEEVYPGNFYGTLKSEVERIWNNDHHVIFDIDVKGGLKLKHMYPEQTLAAFVMPPSIEELRHRLINRSTDDQETIRKRIEKAEYELKFANQFDIILVNDDLKKAQEEAYKIVSKFILK